MFQPVAVQFARRKSGGLSAATLPCGIAETEATQSAAARAERRAIMLEVVSCQLRDGRLAEPEQAG